MVYIRLVRYRFNMNVHFRVIARLTVLIALGILLAPCLSRAQDMPAPLPLSGDEGRVSMPAIASTADQTAVAWCHENADEKKAILLRTRNQLGKWSLPQSIYQMQSPASCSDMAMQYDSANRLQLAWIVDYDGGSEIHYQVFIEGRWLRYEPIRTPSGLQAENLSFHILPADGNERKNDSVFIAWQERTGSYYRIRSFVLDSGGLLHDVILAGEQTMAYVMYPDLVFLPAPSNDPDSGPRMGISWFDLDADPVRLEFRSWNPEESRWEVYSHAYNEQAASLIQSMPLVASSVQGGPYLLGNGEWNGFDQILLQSPSRQAIPLNPAPATHNRFPVASNSSDLVIPFIWQREEADAIYLVQGALHPAGAFAAARLAPVDSYVPAEPDVCWADGALQAVWIAMDQSGDDTGPVLYFQETPITVNDWRIIEEAGE